MKLTRFTDYSLRVLMFLATRPEGQLVQIKTISAVYNISHNHLMKVIYELGKLGYIETVRGRNGGLRLAKDPHTISIGEVVRQTEEDFFVVECFDPSKKDTCLISDACRLQGVLGKALHAFLETLDQYSLGDLIINKDQLQALMKEVT
ncbi:Rrf2 family transcriptional regulator [Sediminibacillus dalangtanensis]|uniref:HTH-type transcriptional regulator NsrR n=1 Tax=Sediminibacillus dalangtanensis TaxID=2729421 RepID=A0ABX7W1J6_9BACI|nr:Rrf2 family transcriptional regulator [Sediminibacillus dalangtanensis]QTN01023.1 Rrf2 family transcriptional regulator [Sediminibacillus dalangtanensis]